MTRETTDRFEIDLSALLDGELEPERMLPLLDALLDRSDLQAFYRAGRQLDQLLEEIALPATAQEGSEGHRKSGWHRIGARADRPWAWIPVPTWAIGAAAALVVAVLAWKAVPDGATSFRIGPGAAVELGGQTRMNDHRFVEMTAELLQADPRYQRKMLDVMNEIESMRAVPEGSNEGRSRRSEEMLAREDVSREPDQLD